MEERKLLVKNGDNLVLSEEAIGNIAKFEMQMQQLKQAEEELKQAILKEMEANGIYKLDAPELCVTYVAEYLKDTFNTKKFKEENAETYKKYLTQSVVKSSLRIKVKNGTMEDK